MKVCNVGDTALPKRSGLIAFYKSFSGMQQSCTAGPICTHFAHKARHVQRSSYIGEECVAECKMLRSLITLRKATHESGSGLETPR